jgi:hypothetical protein
MKMRCVWHLGLILINGAALQAAGGSRLTSTNFQFTLPTGLVAVSVQAWPEAAYAFVTIGTLTREQRVYGYLQPAPSGSTNKEPSAPKLDLKKLGLQLWLLKADGTIIPQLDGKLSPRLSAGGGGMDQVDDSHWFIIFAFKKSSLSELSGVILLKDGKLYSKEIEPGEP